MTLRALDKEGNPKISYELSPSEYYQEWKCPLCSSKLTFINCQKKIKHFRHEVICPYEMEHESKEHRELKKYIYENLKSKYNVDYEYKIGNGIADVVIFLPKEVKIAIECQVSSISYDEWIDRNRNYRHNRTFPIWILHLKNFLKQIDEDDIVEPYCRLKAIERAEMYNPWKLYYDPNYGGFLKRIAEAKPKINSYLGTIWDGDIRIDVGDECKTIFSIIDFEILTPIELIDEIIETPNLLKPRGNFIIQKF